MTKEIIEIQDAIINEVGKAKKQIRTDGYRMSIGELVNLYNDGEIKLDPAFQRLYRWNNDQKTKLIESILIGIPVPEIFVAQKEDNTWHVVDGVQRLSTVLQLAGCLEGYEPLELETCKYIPSLEGQTWKTLPLDIQRAIKRAKLNISIILTQGSDEAQYELFQRLNTGGTSLSEQEVRNCLMLMFNEEFFNTINKLKDYDNFKKCINLKEQDYEEEVHMELILRMFIGYHNKVNYSDYGSLHKIIISDFIDQETIRLMKEANLDEFSDVFKRTFDKLVKTLSKQSFYKYDSDLKRFRGGFNISAFEMLTCGIATNIKGIEQLTNEDLKFKIIGIYSQPEIQTSFGRGIRAIKRFKDATEFARGYFN
ncbi:TPA: DUF262 domain-containing protein [Vibrio alginolyticus]